MPFVQIKSLDRFNWEQVLDLELLPEQQAFLPSILYSLAQAKFENLHPFAILNQDETVGFLMYGEFGGICWINRIMIDHRHQRQGLGSEALRQLIQQLKRNIRCREIRTSYAPDNYGAALFFDQHGFEPMSSLEDEVVVRLG